MSRDREVEDLHQAGLGAVRRGDRRREVDPCIKSVLRVHYLTDIVENVARGTEKFPEMQAQVVPGLTYPPNRADMSALGCTARQSCHAAAKSPMFGVAGRCIGILQFRKVNHVQSTKPSF